MNYGGGLGERVVDVLPYHVEHQGNEIVIRFSSDLLSREEVIEVLDYALLQKHARELALSDDEIAELAKEAKRSMWERLRPMVEEKLRGR
ncbi:MAG TPA: hypothetical protein VM890_07125 [Longimicrobium sp.]|nr:hypothetical protein [Longimicrobium sp.]